MYQILQKFDIHWHDGGPSIAMMCHLRRVSDLLYNWKSCLLCYMKDVVLHCSIFFKWNKLVRVRVRVHCHGTNLLREHLSFMAILRGGVFWKVPLYNSACLENSVWAGVANCFCAHQSYFGVYFLGGQVPKKTNTQITLKWAYEQFIITVYIYILLYFLTWHKWTQKWRLKEPSSRIDYLSHSVWLHSADDIIVDYTMHYWTQQLWYWYLKSYSWWYFHDQLCKKKGLLISNCVFWYF